MHRESTDVRLLFKKNGKAAITSRNPENGVVYLALFNLNDEISKEISIELSNLGLEGESLIKDLWTGENLGKVSGSITIEYQPHACGLYQLF